MSLKTALITFMQTIEPAASSVTLSDFYDEICEDICKAADPPWIGTTTLTVSSGTNRYTYPTAAIRILGVHVGTRQLDIVSEPELESYDREWRGTSTTTAFAVYLGDETARSVRIFPSPAAATTGTWIYSYIPDPIPNWMDLYVSFKTLQREFAYPSDHQDKDVASIYDKLATLTGQLIGVGQ